MTSTGVRRRLPRLRSVKLEESFPNRHLKQEKR